jgi:hypothetical protein
LLSVVSVLSSLVGVALDLGMNFIPDSISIILPYTKG